LQEPGTGKTVLAKALATEVDASLFEVDPTQIKCKWYGSSEIRLRLLFEAAKSKTRSIIFLDEIDGLFTSRENGKASGEVLSQFLLEMNNLKNSPHVFVVAATNLPGALDAALCRRFQLKLNVPLPDLETRIKILELKLKKTKNTLSEKDLEILGLETEG